MKVLAVDPGERVGWAHGRIDADADGLPELTVTGHGISTLKDFVLKLHEVAGNYDVIVWETYRISAKHARKHIGSDVPTLQLIGMIRLCAWLHPNVKLVHQGPVVKATAERTLPTSIQTILDKLPKAHDDSHDADALLHLWHYYWSVYV